MRIALFPSAFHPHFGGVEELVRQLAHSYRRSGHEVCIITNRWPRSLPEYEEYQGLPIHRLAFRVPESGVKSKVSYHLTHRQVEQDLLRCLASRSVELLHVQCISTNGFYALLAKEALNLPLVVTAQGELTMDAGHLYQRDTFMNRCLRQLLDEADYITGCSQKTLEDLGEHVGQHYPQKSRAIFNGVSLEDFAATEPYEHSRPYLLAIGRLVPQKGFDVLIQAYARAGADSHDLLIVGDGPERTKLEALAHGSGVADRIHFRGRADRPAAVAYFRGASFVALPSRADEGLPVVSVETMAAGKAIVASRVGGVPEAVVDNETGLIVPREDVTALSDAIARLTADPSLCGRLGTAGRLRAEKFAWPVIAEQYLDVYRELLEPGVPHDTPGGGQELTPQYA